MSATDLQDSYARACHDFPGAEQGDLAFSSGDVLYIDRQIDRNWCHGQSLTTGRSGIFPSNFVTKLILPRLQQSSSSLHKLFIARDRFIGQEQGDLSFLEGDIVVGLRSIDNNWWEGEAGGRRGIFPLTFVVELVKPTSNHNAAQFLSKHGNQSISSSDHHKSSSPLSISVSSTTINNSELKAKVKHDLRAVDAQELDLKQGEIVVIEEFVDKFTCRGRTADGRRGLFGKGFVEIIDQQKSNNGEKYSSPPPQQTVAAPRNVGSIFGDIDFSTGLLAGGKNRIDDFLEKSISPRSTVSSAEKPKISPKPSMSPRPNQGKSSSSPPGGVGSEEMVAPYGRTKFKFEAEYQGELTFSAGSIIQLIRHVDDEWTEGILNGKRGIFPTSYIDIVVDCPRLQPSIANSPRSINVADQNKSIIGTTTIDLGYASFGNEREAIERRDLEEGKDGAWMVKFDFMGTEDGDLTAFKGDPITMIKHINDEWLEARHLITGQIGVIPITYVQSPESEQEPEVKWREKSIDHEYEIRNRSSSASVFAETTPLQNIRRLDDDSLALVRREQPRWSPAPGLSTQIHSTPLSSIDQGPFPATTPWSPDNGVQFRSKPTMPQQQLQLQFQKNQSQETVAVSKVEKRATPPPRPAVPAALKNKKENETASQHLEMQRQQAKEQKKKEMRIHRSKVFQEVMATEKDYGKDLNMFRETVLAKRNMLDADELLGGPVWGNIIDLSARLLQRLEEESEKDFVYQEIGSAFLELSDEFKRIYGAFCQSHEESQALLDKYETEPEKQVVLKDMLTKVQQKTTCIDLSTMMSRPVQRVLKYPLFLGELLKCTEDNQSDKVKLMMALKVMTEVAQTMNESKRRKDLVTKYRKDGDVTFSERLSRFTLHSVRKKSSRLSMRLSSTIGLTQLAKDDQFEDAERQFRAVDRCCRNLLRDVQSYCEQIVVLYNHQMSIADSMHYGIYNFGGGGGLTSGGGGGTSPRNNSNSNRSSILQWQTGTIASIGGGIGGGGNLIEVGRQLSSLSSSSAQLLSAKYLESWSKILLSESILQKFFDAVNAKVRQPLAHIQHSCKGPEKLISKRGDKLLDYESVAVKLEKFDGGAGADTSKIGALEEDLRKAKVEYEAMNTQLLTELPRFNLVSNEIMTMCVRAFISSQRTFFYEFGRCFEQTIVDVVHVHGSSALNESNGTSSGGGVLEKFQRKHRLAGEIVAHLCFMADSTTTTTTPLQSSANKSGGTLVKRQTSTGSTTGSRASIGKNKSRPTITFPQKLQTEIERCVLRGQYGESQLYLVKGGYEARADLELTLKDGDLVGVIVDKDPMGSGERWFVDNGVSKGFVSRNVLKPLIDESVPKSITTGGSSSQPALIDLNEAVDKRKRPPVVQTPKKSESALPNSAPVAPPKQSKRSVINVARRGSPVIFLPVDKQPTESQNVKPLLRRTTIDRSTGGQPLAPPASHRPTSVVGSMEKTEVSYTSIERRAARRPAPSPPTTNFRTTTNGQEVVNLQPVRPAPRPPPQAVSTTPTPETIGAQRRDRDERSSNDEESEAIIDFYVASFGFTANSENELSLAEGQIVAVHDKKDLESNPEWWLVEDEDGQLGYVPGNYLTPYTDKET